MLLPFVVVSIKKGQHSTNNYCHAAQKSSTKKFSQKIFPKSFRKSFFQKVFAKTMTFFHSFNKKRPTFREYKSVKEFHEYKSNNCHAAHVYWFWLCPRNALELLLNRTKLAFHFLSNCIWKDYKFPYDGSDNFFLIMNQTEFHLVHIIKQKFWRDHIFLSI